MLHKLGSSRKSAGEAGGQEQGQLLGTTESTDGIIRLGVDST